MQDDETAETLFGARVKQLRERIGITQVTLVNTLKLAHGVKLDPSALARMEKGQRSIRLNEAVALGRALDMTVDELLRPALPPEDQLHQAETALDQAKWRAMQAEGEYRAAIARLARLRESLGGGGDGRAADAAPVDVPATFEAGRADGEPG